MSSATIITLRSNGEASARGYACVTVAARSVEPPIEPDRVVLVWPRRVRRAHAAQPATGPRNPDQRTPHPRKAPAIELPDGRPLTKTQHFWIDPEQIAVWDDEERRKQAP